MAVQVADLSGMAERADAAIASRPLPLKQIICIIDPGVLWVAVVGSRDDAPIAE
jgi:hypothetical protein